jgi:hypothetical protein
MIKIVVQQTPHDAEDGSTVFSYTPVYLVDLIPSNIGRFYTMFARLLDVMLSRQIISYTELTWILNDGNKYFVYTAKRYPDERFNEQTD